MPASSFLDPMTNQTLDFIAKLASDPTECERVARVLWTAAETIAKRADGTADVATFSDLRVLAARLGAPATLSDLRGAA